MARSTVDPQTHLLTAGDVETVIRCLGWPKHPIEFSDIILKTTLGFPRVTVRIVVDGRLPFYRLPFFLVEILAAHLESTKQSSGLQHGAFCRRRPTVTIHDWVILLAVY
jgi:hypothetical protein